MSKQAVAFTAHDHKQCRAGVLEAVDRACAERRLRLTPVRRQTLEILLESHVGMGAYEILKILSKKGFGEKPPMVYRALGFLIDEGFVHKLQHQNSYVACTRPSDCVNPCLLVCSSCGKVAETSIPQVSKNISRVACMLGFTPSNTVMELSGICAMCPEG